MRRRSKDSYEYESWLFSLAATARDFNPLLIKILAFYQKKGQDTQDFRTTGLIPVVFYLFIRKKHTNDYCKQRHSGLWQTVDFQRR